MLPIPGGATPENSTDPKGARSADTTQSIPQRNRRPGIPQQAAADPRFRLSWWVAAGVIPAELAPCSIAAAYCRAFGQAPARDPEHRATRVYSLLELTGALAELALQRQQQAAAARTVAPPRIAAPPAPPAPPPPPPPPPTIAEVWRQALRALELPSTRMLLIQQAQLLGVSPAIDGELLAVIAIAPQWRPMILARAELIRAALAATLQRPIALRFVEREVQP